MKANTIKTDAAFFRMADEAAQLMPKIKKLKAALDAALQETRKAPEAELAALQAALDAKLAALKDYFEADGAAARLCKPGKKFGESAAATFGLRAGKGKLALLEGRTEADVVAALLAEGHADWLRERSPELNKAAILGAGLSADDLADLGLALSTEASFYLKPKDNAAMS